MPGTTTTDSWLADRKLPLSGMGMGQNPIHAEMEWKPYDQSHTSSTAWNVGTRQEVVVIQYIIAITALALDHPNRLAIYRARAKVI